MTPNGAIDSAPAGAAWIPALTVFALLSSSAACGPTGDETSRAEAPAGGYESPLDR
jgi:hypothetical protein